MVTDDPPGQGPSDPNAEADAGSRRRWQRLIESDDADPLEVLRTVGTYQRYLTAIEAEAVQTARRLGRSWDDIADAFGVTRQSAWARFAHRERGRSSGPPGRLPTAIQLRCSCGTGRVFYVSSYDGTTVIRDPLRSAEFLPDAVSWTCGACGEEHMSKVDLLTL